MLKEKNCTPTTMKNQQVAQKTKNPLFNVIYADPPWDINQRGRLGAVNHYNLMTLDQIKNMPVANLTSDDAACFLWITNCMIPEGLEVLNTWGFTYRGYYVWAKSQLGLGQYFRNASEMMLLGTKGKMPVAFKGQANWGFLPRQEHSHKPEETYAIIERLYPRKEYLELFARKRPSNPNWYIWGNEAEGGSDIIIPGYPVPEYTGRVTNPYAVTEATEEV